MTLTIDITPSTRTVSTAADAVDTLLGAAAEAAGPLRARRPVTVAQTQASHDALFGVDSAGVSLADKLAIAVFTARLHGDETTADLYAARLVDSDRAAVVREAAASGAVTGPYGAFASPELGAFSTPGPAYRAPAQLVERVGVPLAAALEYAHALVFRPREATPAWLEVLAAAGWSDDAIVTISQEVAFLSFQLRVAAGLAVLAGDPLVLTEPVARRGAGAAAAEVSATHDGARPGRFTTAQLEWDPWLAPVAEDALTDEQRDALVDAGRAKSPYFRLLARDPQILKARTLADKDIFYNIADGLPRAERELAAAAVSRVNGCIFCASVHSRFAAHYSKRPDDVQRLLDEGVAGAQEGRWRAIVDAAAALTATPAAFSSAHVDALRAEGLTDAEVSDLIHASAFFAWANRLMLALGDPRVP